MEIIGDSEGPGLLYRLGYIEACWRISIQHRINAKRITDIENRKRNTGKAPHV